MTHIASRNTHKPDHYSQALATLASADNKAGSAAAQLISAVAAIELPLGQWSNLLPELTSKVLSPENANTYKISALQTIGYICESTDTEVLTRCSDKILTAVIHGVRASGNE